MHRVNIKNSITPMLETRTCSTLMRAFSSLPSASNLAISFLLILTDSTPP